MRKEFLIRIFGGDFYVFSVILILLIAIVFRKQKMDETGQQKSDEIEYLSKNKKELILGLAWYIFYFILSYISCAFQVDIISELSNIPPQST